MTAEEDDDIQAAEYVIGLLATEERAEFERRIATDNVLAAKVAKWQHDLSPLDAGYGKLRAPDQLGVIERRLFGRTDSSTPVLRKTSLASKQRWSILAAVIALLTFIIWRRK
ncbi:MAG: hypothetical protein ACK4YU_12835 [Paracoccus sp. (in: a-proteobacteria)]